MVRNILITMIALTCVASGARAQDQTDNTYFYSNGERVELTVFKNLVAVRFTGKPEYDAVESIVGSTRLIGPVANKRYQQFEQHDVFVYEVPDRQPLTMEYRSNLLADLSRDKIPVADVSQLVRVERTGTYAVLTDELSIGFEDGDDWLGDVRVGDSGMKVAELLSEGDVLNKEPLVKAYRVLSGSRVDAIEIAKAVREYKQGRKVIYATPTLEWNREFREIPNDDLFDQQWHLHDATQADVDALKAWVYARGADSLPGGFNCNVPDKVRIAVFDDAILTTHEDLVDNISSDGRDYTKRPYGSDPNPANPDEDHGTQVAGVIAACGNNGKGVVGICPYCEIVPIKIDPFLTGHLLYALYGAANELDVDVITNSWGGSSGSLVTDDIRTALKIITGTGPWPRHHSIPVFFAAPNSNVDLCIGPDADISALPSVIAVSAASSADKAGIYGGYGDCIDLVAPTQPDLPYFPNMIVTTKVGPGDRYTTHSNGFGGTSSSTALTAGIAGLVLSLNRDLSEHDVRSILQHTAEKIALLPNGNTYDDEGFSERAGYGRVNAHRAVVPVVKIASTKTSVQVGEPFDITVSASAPYFLSEIGWSRQEDSCTTIEEDWRQVPVKKAFQVETWHDYSLNTPGVYVFKPNARDSRYRADIRYSQNDGYPHQASEAFEHLPEVTVTVIGDEGANASCDQGCSASRNFFSKTLCLAREKTRAFMRRVF